MLKYIPMSVLLLLSLVSGLAVEAQETKCNSGSDCYDKAYYLFIEKGDKVKSPRYAHKGCFQYNNAPSCMIGFSEIDGDIDTNGDKYMQMLIKLGNPGALFYQITLQPNFIEFYINVENNNLQDYLNSENGMSKTLSFSKDFLNLCYAHHKLWNKVKNDKSLAHYFELTYSLTKISSEKILSKLSKYPKTNNEKFDDIVQSLHMGIMRIGNGDCYHQEHAVKELDDFINDKRKYDDL